MTTQTPKTWRREVGQGLVVAGVLLQAAVIIRSLTPDSMSTEAATRISGALTGMVLIFYANAVPKTLPSWSRMRRDPRGEQALRRLVGWSLTVGGLGYTAAWMAAPIESALALSTSTLGASLMLVILRVASHTRERKSA
jgi:hypothetical protein